MNTEKRALIRKCDGCGMITAIALDGLGIDRVKGETIHNVPLAVGMDAWKTGGKCRCEILQPEKQESETLLDMIRNEHRMAVKKHPFFCHRLMSPQDKYYADHYLKEARHELSNEVSGNCVSAKTVLNCELAEAQAAYSDGDLDHALVELAQCAAVIIRMMEMVKKESEGKPTAKTKAVEQPSLLDALFGG